MWIKKTLITNESPNFSDVATLSLFIVSELNKLCDTD